MHQQINNSSAGAYPEQRDSAVSSSNQDSNRMSTRHKGQRVQDYAAMLKTRNAFSPPNKRFKMGDQQHDAGGGFAASRGKHISSRSKGSGLGFADSDEEREAKDVRPFGHEDSQEPEEEGEHEQIETNQSHEEMEQEEQGESEINEDEQ